MPRRVRAFSFAGLRRPRNSSASLSTASSLPSSSLPSHGAKPAAAKRSSPHLSVSDAADLVQSMRPHLRGEESQMLVSQFLRSSDAGLAGMIRRVRVVELMSLFSRDHEYLYKLHDRFVSSRRSRPGAVGGLTFREFVRASVVWTRRTPAESMSLQFSIFDLDGDGVLSERDRLGCLQFGMDPRLRAVLQEQPERKMTENSFIAMCRQHGLRFICTFALGPLTYSFVTEQERAEAAELQRRSQAQLAGGFAHGIAEFADGMGVGLTITAVRPNSSPDAPGASSSEIRAVTASAAALGAGTHIDDIPMALPFELDDVGHTQVAVVAREVAG